MKKYFPKWLRLFLLNIGRKLIEAEGLTAADIRWIGNEHYIVDKDGSFYLIKVAPGKANQKMPAHNLRVIK